MSSNCSDIPFCFLPFPWGLRGCFLPLLSGGLLRPHPVIQDPYWWQWLPDKVPAAHQEQFWGLASCSRILPHVAQFHPRGAGTQTSNLLITSPPALPTEIHPPLFWHTCRYYTYYVITEVQYNVKGGHPRLMWPIQYPTKCEIWSGSSFSVVDLLSWITQFWCCSGADVWLLTFKI